MDKKPKDEEQLAKDLEPLIQQMVGIYDNAVAAYTPLVEDICSRRATEKEVGWLLTWMLDFAGEERMLNLYKRVCRAYWNTYPETVAYVNRTPHVTNNSHIDHSQKRHSDVRHNAGKGNL